MTVTVAVLALQGAFAEHERALRRLGADAFEIRQRADLRRPFDALVIPGGESTVIGKLLGDLGLLLPLRSMINAGLPAFGTCAGLIVLSKKVIGGAPSLATVDVTVRRNAYGRQLGSFHTEGWFEGLGRIPMTFIRAPCIESTGEGVEVLAEVGGRIAAAKQGRQLVTAFHPELCRDLSVHRYFLEEIAGLELHQSNRYTDQGGRSERRSSILDEAPHHMLLVKPL